MKRLAWSILVILPFGAPATEVYRSVDENGVVVYSDRPGDSKELVVVRPVVDTFGTSASARGGNANGPQATPNSLLAVTSANEATEQPSAAERARNCLVARERAETYSSSRRLFRTLADGEREYLSDAEIEEARTKAQSDVANWCD